MHTTLDDDGGRAAAETKGTCRMNIVLSNVKRAIGGIYDAIK